MKYQLKFKRQAIKDLKALSPKSKERIIAKIVVMQDNLQYEEFLKLQEMLEDMEDLKDLRTAVEQDKDSPDYPLEEVKKMLDIT